MFKHLSLNKKLLLVLCSTAIIPLVLLSGILLFNIDRGFSTLTEQTQESTKNSVINSLDIASMELLELTKLHAEDKELIDIFRTSTRDSLAVEVQPIFDRLHKEQKLSVFEFGDEHGIVSFRGHNPAKFGDDKGELAAIQATLDGEELSGFEFGSSGLAVRAFVPIKYNNEIIGTLQTGIDDHFLEKITQSIQGVQLNLYNEKGETIASSNKDQVGTFLKDQATIDKVLSGTEISLDNEKSLQTFIPMYDPTKTVVIGMIGIAQDISIIKQVDQTTTFITFIVLGLTLLIVTIVALLFSRSISHPIKQVAYFMDELAKGNFDKHYQGKESADEIGLLTRSMIQMQKNFKEMVLKIRNASDVIKNQSTFLTQSANEMSDGSQQIAATMQELSGGAESQANSSLELAERMSDFSQKTQFAAKNGDEISSTTKQVLELTEQGRKMMETSVKEMSLIYNIVTDSVAKVNELDEQAKQITGMIKVIQNIAEQTNLLALNAAIEAARAGEHGKGFAIVADEVRKLSEQVKLSVGDITQTVNSIQHGSKQVTVSLEDGYEKVSSGTMQIQTTGKTFTEITDSVSNMVEKINIIATNLAQINNDTATIQLVIEQIASISEESAAGIEETAASSQQTSSSMEQISNNAKTLEHLSKDLNDLVRQFNI
jgi:methyl-accepting chemotaxis protein